MIVNAESDTKNIASGSYENLTWITVHKTKITYECGDLLNADDLTLTVSYNGLTASVDLTVTELHEAASEEDVEGVGNYTGTSKKSVKFNILKY